MPPKFLESPLDVGIKRFRVDLHLYIGEAFVVVLPENRTLRRDDFEALAI